MEVEMVTEQQAAALCYTCSERRFGRSGALQRTTVRPRTEEPCRCSECNRPTWGVVVGGAK